MGKISRRVRIQLADKVLKTKKRRVEISALLFIYKQIMICNSLLVRYRLYVSRVHKIENSWEEHNKNKINDNH